MTPILLIEDNHDDEALTIRAFRKNNIRNAPLRLRRQGKRAI